MSKLFPLSLLLLLASWIATPARGQESYEVALPGAIREVPRNPRIQEQLDRSERWTNFLLEHPGWTAQWNERLGTPERAHGPSLMVEAPQSQEEADRAALSFLEQHARAWTDKSDFRLVRAASRRGAWWVQYAQTHRGVRVVGGRAVVRIAQNGAVPLFGIETFPDVAGDVIPSIDAATAIRAASEGFPDGVRVENVDTEVVLVPVEEGDRLRYRLAYEVSFVTWEPAGGWVSLVDARDGTLLERRSIVHYADVAGEVTTSIEPLQVEDTQSIIPQRYSNVLLLENSVTVSSTVTGPDGGFMLPREDGKTYVLRTELAGPFGRIHNNSFGNETPLLEATIPPDSTLKNFGFADTNSRVQDRDAFYWAMVSHDHIQEVDPGFHLLDYAMPIVTDFADAECNAFWNGTGVTFFPKSLPESERNCENTARSASVVIHEYGHGITDLQYRPFAPSAAMHEGFSDYYSATVLEDPRIGHGFVGRGTFLRTIENTLQSPGDLTGEPHLDGLIIAGALWDARQILGKETTDALWHFARYGAADNFDDYFFDVLLEDDEDGNVYNGTPNFDVLVDSFQGHGVGDYSVHVSHVEEPDTEDLGKTFAITASFLSIFAIQDESVDLHLEFTRDGNTTNETRDMTPTGGVREYTTMLAAEPLGAEIRYWFTASDIEGHTVVHPAAGGSDPFTFRIGEDTVPPTIVHERVPDQPVNQPAIRFFATVTDNLDVGVGSVDLVVSLNGLPETETAAIHLGEDLYEADLPGAGLALGDEVAYRIVAADSAASPNEATVPDMGSNLFRVVRGVGLDFEADNGGLTADGDWEWGTTSFFPAFSGAKVWGTRLEDAYTDGLASSLVLGPMDLGAFSKAGLSFRHVYLTEPFFDGGTVFASTDGNEWDILRPDGDYPVPFLFVNGIPGYNGSVEDWTLAEFDLSSFAGAPAVWIRFTFEADEGLANLGWYLDDVQLVERQVLSRPLGLSATSGRDGSVPLSWNLPAGPEEGGVVTGYNVYRREGEAFVKLNDVPVTERSYDDDQVTNGLFYTYAVTAVYADGESQRSLEVEAIPFVATYASAQDSISVQVDEGEDTTASLVLENAGTGFLRAALFPAYLGESLSDVRILYPIAPGGPGAGRMHIFGSKTIAPPTLAPGGPGAGRQHALSSKTIAHTFAPATLREGFAKLAGAPRPTPMHAAAAIPPPGEYDVLHSDPNDVAAGPVPDLATIEAQLGSGSLYFRITAQEAWEDLSGFNLVVALDTDRNPDTHPMGDAVLLAGAFPMNEFGIPSVLLSGDFDFLGVPHHEVLPENGNAAEFGFFLQAIGQPEAAYVTAASLDATGEAIRDLIPDAREIPWMSLSSHYAEIFAGDSASIDVGFDSGILTPFKYRAAILMDTNDPLRPEVSIPVSMQVGEETPVRLLSFEGSSTEDGVRLRWQTSDERDHLGFHVYRAPVSGEEVRVTADLIRSETGEYAYVDRAVEDGKDYLYRIADLGRSGELTFHGPVLVRYRGVSDLAAPVLRQNVPNPVRGETAIRFGLPQEGFVTIRIHAMDGRLVRTVLEDASFPRGFHEVAWDGKDASGRRVAAGVYGYRLEAPGTVLQRKLVVIE